MSADYRRAVENARRALDWAKHYERQAEDCRQQREYLEKTEQEWRRLAEQYIDVARAYEAVAANHKPEEAHERTKNIA